MNNKKKMRGTFTLILLLLGHLLRAQFNSLDMNTALPNTAYDEQSPVLSPDGKTLYFTIGNHPQNMGGKKDPGDIWYSSFNGSQWSEPMHAGNHLNDIAYNAVAGISANGNELFLHGHYSSTPTSAARTQGIAIAKRNDNEWSKPENITIPYFHNKSGIISGSLNNSAFVFSAETYGTHGVDDIYVSLNTNGKWSAPKNLGSVINTQLQELSPYLSNDGKTLYFSSNGWKGKGSFDVYVTTRLDDTWTNWSEPINLETINTDGRELFFKIHNPGNLFVFTSTQNSDGYGDIRFYNIPNENNSLVDGSLAEDTIATSQPDVISTAEPVPTQSNNVAGMRINGKVTDSKTGEAIETQLSFSSVDGDVISASSDDAGYNAVLDSTGVYTIKVEATGYVSILEKLNVEEYESKSLELNFSLQPVEIGTTVNLKNVLFAKTKDDFLPESRTELDLVVSFLQKNPTVKIHLSGHTDNRGVHADNVKLSQKRVNKVKAYLVSQGIESNRITGRGYGGVKPIASNDTEESRKLNRRVEFTVKKF